MECYFALLLPKPRREGREPFAVHALSSHGLTSGGFFAAIGSVHPTTSLKNHKKLWANLIRPQ